jgi:hypothetical protein
METDLLGCEISDKFQVNLVLILLCVPFLIRIIYLIFSLKFASLAQVICRTI